MIKTKDIYWLSGLLEGEGCFQLQKGRQPIIVVAMTDRDVIERVAALMGSNVHVSRARDLIRKPIYRTVIASRKAAGWMMTLCDLMGERRRAKIVEILQQWRLNGKQGQWDRNAKRQQKENAMTRLLAIIEAAKVRNPDYAASLED